MNTTAVERAWPRFTALRVNAAANLAGRVWTMGLGLIFIPIYLRFLGIEAYGLVGFFAVLQGVLGFFDLGLGSTINRELARFSARSDSVADQRSVLRSLEVCYWAISASAGLLVVALAPLIAHRWIQPGSVPPATIEGAVKVMGFVLALQPPFAFYQSALMGLQRQVELNAIVIVTGTLRSAGTAVMLWLVAPTIGTFFLCQLVVSAVQTSWTMLAVWNRLGGFARVGFSRARVSSVWRYASATAANSLVGVALTQVDKIVLSRLLPLEQFGYYALAGTMASFVWAVAIPLNQALFPRFAQLVELGDENTLRGLYHRAAQIMAVALVPASATAIFFSWYVMFVWTRNPITADHTALVAALLIAGTTINGIVSVPGYFQAAAGWPQLMVYTNAAAAVLLVPAILALTPRYGAPGAAAVWVLLNAGYFVFNIPLMHRRFLRGEQWKWYVQDVALPVSAAVLVAAAGRWLAPDALSRVGAAAWMLGVWALAALACGLAAPQLRAMLFGGRAAQASAA